jgi:hypothetical protein
MRNFVRICAFFGRAFDLHSAQRGQVMSEDVQGTNTGMTVLGLLLALGLIFGGWVMGAQIKATRLSDRYVSVRGLAERDVKSDLAIWTLAYKDAGDELPALTAKIQHDTNNVLQFLAAQGLQNTEIELGVASVTDTLTNEFGPGKPGKRYIAVQRITVRTTRVDQVAAAARKSIELIQKGVVLNNANGQGLTYKFNSLNSIKPDMISEATRNARSAANRFALDSGSRVGTIRQAEQGIFSISAANQGSNVDDSGAFGNVNSDSSLMKTVRVVTSVEYYLER